MIDILDFLFPRIFTGLAAFLCFLSIYCFAMSLPPKSQYQTYGIVQKILGVAFLQWAIHLAIICIFKLRVAHPFIASALHIQSYYIAFTLIGTGAIMMITPHNVKENRGLIKRRIIHSTLFCIILVTNIVAVHTSALRYGVLAVVTLVYLVELTVLCYKFLKAYNRATVQLDNHYADDNKSMVLWQKRAILLNIPFALIAPVSVYASDWLTTLYTFISIPCVFYMFLSFQNYRYYLDMLDIIESTEDENESILINEESGEDHELLQTEKERNERLKEALEQWIDRMGYTQKSITITELAKSLGTNRTYLTRCIQSEYQVSFRDWIGNLRITYAKHLLSNELLISISDISTKAGYSSPSYFTKVFTESCGISPKVWRELKVEEQASSVIENKR